MLNASIRPSIGVIAAAAVLFQATSSGACASFAYAAQVAQGRVLDRDDHWRPVTIKASRQYIRFEYADPRTPWGRLVVVGNTDRGHAAIFPMSISGEIPNRARITWRTSLSDALLEIGLSDALIGRGSYSDAPTVPNGDLPCNPAADTEQFKNDPTICILKAATYLDGVPLPAFASTMSGKRYFELTKVTRTPVPAAEFKAPPDFLVTFRKPKYLRAWNCSGEPY